MGQQREAIFVHEFVVMADYGSEGWKVQGEIDELDHAVRIREEALNLSSNLVIFRPVKIKTIEDKEEETKNAK